MVDGSPNTVNEGVQITLKWMKMALADAQTNLACAQKRMAIAVNHSRRSEEYVVCDKVFLSIKHLKNIVPTY